MPFARSSARRFAQWRPGPVVSALACGGLALLASGSALGEPGIKLDPAYKSSLGHKVVLITEQQINPDEIELAQGQLVAWISYAPQSVTVVFDREVARNMICHSLVNFALRDGKLKSDPIAPGEFASFCELQPGKYDYRVIHESSSPGEDDGHELKGTLIVGDAG